jgi:hypothetical protein
MAPVKREEGG